MKNKKVFILILTLFILLVALLYILNYKDNLLKNDIEKNTEGQSSPESFPLDNLPFSKEVYFRKEVIEEAGSNSKKDILKSFPFLTEGDFENTKNLESQKEFDILLNNILSRYKIQPVNGEHIDFLLEDLKSGGLEDFVEESKDFTTEQQRKEKKESEDMVEVNKTQISAQKNIENVKNDYWRPKVSDRWQWQLDGEINITYDVEVYDLDLFDTPQKVINQLHQKGKKVICYFNAGAYEPYRIDSKQFPQEVLGSKMEGWEDERWLDISRYELFADIIKDRLDLAVAKKCDAIEPDNINGYQEKTGFDLSYNDQLVYNKWLAQEAHKRGVSIALKNDGEQVNDLIDYFDFAIVEECLQYQECLKYKRFTEKDKAVFSVEYDQKYKNENQFQKLCSDSNKLKFQTLFLPIELDDSFRVSCF